jgi:hypothetical protein
MDEVKIIESSNSKSFLSHPQNRNLQLDIVQPYLSHSKIQIQFTKTPDRIMSGPAKHCPAPLRHCPDLESESNG